MKQLNLHISTNTLNLQEYYAFEQQKNKERKLKQQSKRIRLKVKTNKKRRGKKIMDDSHQYEGGFIPDYNNIDGIHC